MTNRKIDWGGYKPMSDAEKKCASQQQYAITALVVMTGLNILFGALVVYGAISVVGWYDSFLFCNGNNYSKGKPRSYWTMTKQCGNLQRILEIGNNSMESSSVVEPSAVNRLVVSSNLTSPVSKKYSEKVLTSSEYSV
jgi:hypothetical protein